MASLTFYPNAHPEATSVDGWVVADGGVSGLDWATLIAHPGTDSKDDGKTATVGITSSPNEDKWRYLFRVPLLFDISSMPSGIIVTSITLTILSKSSTDNLDINPDICVFDSAPASNIALVAGDFDSFGNTPLSNAIPMIGGWNGSGSNTFTFNAAGIAAVLAAIAGDGILKLGLRNANYDVAGVAPAWKYSATGLSSNFNFYIAEQGGTARPKLTINFLEGAPVVTTNPASDIAGTYATLNLTLDDDGGEECDCCFEWGKTVAYGETTPTEKRTAGQTLAQQIIGLDSSTTYHFRAKATNSAGTVYGADLDFITTGIVIPTVTTGSASPVYAESAVLNGNLVDDGGGICTCCFEWGETIGYGHTTSLVAKSTGESFAIGITGLVKNILYHFRAKATNSAGTAYGSDNTFTTQTVSIRWTEFEIVNALLDRAGWPASKRQIDDSNPQTYYFWCDNQSALQGIRNLETISCGFFYIDHRGYAVWESRYYRSLYRTSSVATFFDDMISGLTYELSDREIFNVIQVRIRPLQVAGDDGSSEDKQVKMEWSPGKWIYYNDVQKFTFYTDSGEEAASWGIPGAVIKRNNVDVTSQMIIWKSKETRTTCTVSISNTVYEGLPHVHIYELWVNYTPLEPTEPEGTPPAGGWAEGQSLFEVEDVKSIQEYGRRVKTIYLPFPMEYEEAEDLANYCLSYYKQPVPDVKMKIINKNDALLTQILERHISDRIIVVNAELSLVADFYINKVKHTLSQGGLYHEAIFTLEKIENTRLTWVLGTSQLGINTNVGF